MPSGQTKGNQLSIEENNYYFYYFGYMPPSHWVTSTTTLLKVVDIRRLTTLIKKTMRKVLSIDTYQALLIM